MIIMVFRKINQIWQRIFDDVVFKPLFSLCEIMGFHITKNHYYQPVPNTRTLSDTVWSRRSELIGINMNEQKQIELLTEFLGFKDEYDAFPQNRTSIPWQYYCENPNFGPVDTEILFCMIRYFKPEKIIEIGCGYSTYLSAQAILKNEEESGFRAELIAIEPYPDEVLREGFPGLSRVIVEKAENVDVAEFNELKGNDILFIDSSHVLKIGNDVQYEYLELLPRLGKNVIVHVHDIFFPREYPREWVLNMHRFWNEQYLLQAFLAFNTAFEILWCGSYMHLNYPEKLEQAFISYNQETVWQTRRPGATSLWLRKIV
jgi:predicted O-methyltransferase YrrM